MVKLIDRIEDGKPPMLAYSIGGLVAATSLSRATIYENIRGGLLVAHKVGRRTIILKESVDRWLSSLK